MSANEKQIGGRHYKQAAGGEEHWDRVNRLGLDYFQACITKYVERWKLKGGIEDLRKAAHFLEKYIELNIEVIWVAEERNKEKIDATTLTTDDRSPFIPPVISGSWIPITLQFEHQAVVGHIKRLPNWSSEFDRMLFNNQLKLEVGGIVRKQHREGDKYVIDDVELLEVSLVAIPAVVANKTWKCKHCGHDRPADSSRDKYACSARPSPIGGEQPCEPEEPLRSEIKPTAYVDFTYEGGTSTWDLFRCKHCRQSIYVSPPGGDPATNHSCAGLLAAMERTGAGATGAYVRQD